MYKIEDCSFDHERLIIYKSTVSDQLVVEAKSIIDAKEDESAKILSHLEKSQNRKQIKGIGAVACGICITYKCNLRCTYCGYSSTDDSEHSLSMVDIEIFIDGMLKKWAINKLITNETLPFVVCFTGGGEPTYDWDFFVNVVTHIKKQCTMNEIPLYLMLSTNGILTDVQIAFIAENFSSIMVSYDGLPEIQNRNRRSLSKDKTNRTVEYTIRELSARAAYLNIRTTIWESDYPRISEMFDHIMTLIPKDSNSDWSIQPTLFEGRATNRMKHQRNEERSNFIKYYTDLVQSVILNYGEDMAKKIQSPLLTGELCGYFCGAHSLHNPWLLPDKTLVTCLESRDYNTCFGRIDSDRICYDENYYDDLLKISKEKFIECRDCISYRVCKGGCPIWHLRDSNNGGKPLECIAQVEYWSYILKSLTEGKYGFGWKLERFDEVNLAKHDIFKLVKDE